MELIRDTNFDFLGKRKIGFFLSIGIIIIGLISLGIHRGPNFGIDFRGGVKIRAKFNRPVGEAELGSKLSQLGYDLAKIQVDASKKEASIDLGYRPEFEKPITAHLASEPGDSNATSIPISPTSEHVHLFQPGDVIQLLEGEKRARNEIREIVSQSETVTFELVNPIGVDFTQGAVVQMQVSAGRILSDALMQETGDWYAVSGGVNVSEVGPSVGKDLKWAALWSVLLSIAVLLAYIRFRFESVRFAIGAIAALIHDVLITLGIFSVFMKEINLPTVAAFLTIIGYSLNDTIVVFDRIRENMNLFKGVDYADIINRSINQSLSRTIITSLTTLFVVLTIFFLSSPGEEINTFALALIVGVIVGTYSSVFVASPILHLWHLRDQRQVA